MGLDILIAINDQTDSQLSDQVSNVEVYEKIDQNTQYKLTFMVDICDEDIARSLGEKTSPGSTLSVVARVKDDLVCLVKGPVTQQEIHLQHGGSGSWIKVEGEDTGYGLDRTVSFNVFTGTDADIVTGILSNSPQMSADVESTPQSSHEEEDNSLVQRETDLSLIRSLARRNGYHFWITYTNEGEATGHFRSRSLDGTPGADLIINADTYNIESLRLNADARSPSRVISRQLNLRTKEVMGGETTLDDPRLGEDGLQTVAGGEGQSIHLAPVVDDAGALDARSTAALRDAQWFIHATCKTSVFRLCKIVRAHTLVNLQGAGSRYSGKYYVSGVRHTIDPAAHVMDLELERNAWGTAPAGGAGLLSNIF